MSPRKCSLRRGDMVPLENPRARFSAIQVAFCRVCDRRRCKLCDHHEQDPFSNKCTNCGDIW